MNTTSDLRWPENLAGLTLIALAVWFRVWQFDRIPGINGDECWYGLFALDYLGGQSLHWRTPTGNLVNPFFMIPTVGLHGWFERSVTLLRVIPLASGLLALLVNYVLARSWFGSCLALISTTVLGCLPINIAYSRFGWDPSQTLLAATLVVYSSLWLERMRNGVALASLTMSMVVAMIIHPTNIFLAPIAGMAIGMSLPGAGWRLRNWLSRCDVWIVIGLSFMLACAIRSSIQQSALVPMNLLRLFTGVTVYRYLTGATLPQGGPEWSTYDIVSGVIAATLCVVSVRAVWRNVQMRFVVAGTELAIGALIIVGGPQSLLPHLERYALFMIAPVTLVVCIGATQRNHVWGPRVLLIICASLLIGFHANYFEQMMTTGGTSAFASRAGPVEPKLAAFEEIMKSPDDHVDVFTDEWWIRKPIQYFSHGEAKVTVQPFDELTHAVSGHGGKCCVVLFENDPSLGELDRQLTANNRNVRKQSIRDFGGREVVVLLWVSAAAQSINIDGYR